MKKSKKYNYTKKRPPRRYDNDKIQNGETSKKFAAELKERLATLLDDDNATTMPNDFYNKFKNIVHTTTELEIGYKQFNEVPGLSNEAKDIYARRRKAKFLVLNNPNNVENINNYRTLNKRVKIAVKKQKNDNLSDIISEMEENLKKNNSHKLFKQVKELEGKRYKPVFSMKNSQGQLMMKKHDI